MVPVPNLYARTLKRAAQVAGGTEQLATLLKVPRSYVSLWIAGGESAPAEIFLKAVDLISESDGSKPSPS